METSERRAAIMKLLCRHRHDTVKNLAAEFGVSERTIRRDIDALSLQEPIYTQSGRYGGGIYVTDNYSMDRMYFTKEETEVLHKIRNYVEKSGSSILTHNEKLTLENLIKDYTKPGIKF